jgi:hypothetical protein
MASGTGCGARARVSHARTREAPASRPAPLRGSARKGCTCVPTKGGGSRRDRVCRKRPGLASGSSGAGDENRRRGAPRGAAPWRQGVHIRNGRAIRRATPLILRDKGKTTAYPGPAKNAGTDVRALLSLHRTRGGKRPASCLVGEFLAISARFPVGVKRPQSGHPRRSWNRRERSFRRHSIN